jgi:multiple antibiotic resistance protein
MPLDLQANFDASLRDMVQAIVTVLAVINPVVCGSIFLTLTPALAPVQRRWAAVKVALSILIILVVSALIGLKVLSIFSISLDVFRIVGGMIIAYMGFEMLRGHHIRRSVKHRPRMTILLHRARLLRSSCSPLAQGRLQPW